MKTAEEILKEWVKDCGESWEWWEERQSHCAEYYNLIEAGRLAGLEEAEKFVKNRWPRGHAHTYASENADRYRALEDASETLAKGIAELKKEGGA